jgi:hypothetical protein
MQAPGGRGRFVRLLFQCGFHWNYQLDARPYSKVLDEDSVCQVSSKSGEDCRIYDQNLIYDCQQRMPLNVPMLTKKNVTKILWNECRPNQRENGENSGKISFIPVSKLWLSLYLL